MSAWEPDEYLVARIQDALARDRRAGELGIEVRIAGGKVFLHGAVSSEERRAAVAAVAGDVAIGPDVCDETEVAPRADGGGGFAGACATEFGEAEMRAFVAHTRVRAPALQEQLEALSGTERVDARIALMHYAPVPDTLAGERLEIHPFLGSYLSAEAVDAAGADLVVHGHAHGGTEKGVTPGGIHVRNVAQPVIRHAYNLYRLQSDDADMACPTEDADAPVGTPA